MTTDDLLRSADEWLSAFHNKGGVTVPPGSYLDLIRDLAAALRDERSHSKHVEEWADSQKERAELAERERDEARAEIDAMEGK